MIKSLTECIYRIRNFYFFVISGGNFRQYRTKIVRYCAVSFANITFVEQSCDFLRQTRNMQARHVQNPIYGHYAVLTYGNL